MELLAAKELREVGLGLMDSVYGQLNILANLAAGKILLLGPNGRTPALLGSQAAEQRGSLKGATPLRAGLRP